MAQFSEQGIPYPHWASGEDWISVRDNQKIIQVSLILKLKKLG